MKLEDLPIDIYLDGASITDIERSIEDPLIKGFTTNPTLARRAGVTDYKQFCMDVAKITSPKPVSLEVIADDLAEIERQAMVLAECGSNVYVKVPVMTSRGEWSNEVVERLGKRGINLNITAIMCPSSVDVLWQNLSFNTPIIFSIFSGRIADTLRTPPYLSNSSRSSVRFLWASTREPWNIHQAVDLHYNIITASSEILEKARKFYGMDLKELTMKTVSQFHEDAKVCGYEL